MAKERLSQRLSRRNSCSNEVPSYSWTSAALGVCSLQHQRCTVRDKEAASRLMFKQPTQYLTKAWVSLQPLRIMTAFVQSVVVSLSISTTLRPFTPMRFCNWWSCSFAMMASSTGSVRTHLINSLLELSVIATR
uniref:Uncharacterized protein n=1 Tax=Trichuris muris TaxID=70415 RepID=A0A5S6QKN2_TRIMR